MTIGWFGKERVDYITYDTKGVWRCYEVKVGKSDFYSKAAKTFIGHYNYFVMPKELYEQVKHDIPAHVGVYDGHSYIKRPKKQELMVDEHILLSSMIRSLSREFQKQYKSGNPTAIEILERQIRRLTSEKDRYRKDLRELERKLYTKFGRHWYNLFEE